jgi:heme/copper-type cytochrome/quinol oxidase subunit 4
MIKLPRSYEIVESMKNVPEKDLETKLFNDIARSVVKKEVVEKIQGMKGILIFYFGLTFINILFDLVDFLYILSRLDKDGIENNEKVILLSLFIIVLLYICKYLFKIYFRH